MVVSIKMQLQKDLRTYILETHSFSIIGASYNHAVYNEYQFMVSNEGCHDHSVVSVFCYGLGHNTLALRIVDMFVELQLTCIAEIKVLFFVFSG